MSERTGWAVRWATAGAAVLFGATALLAQGGGVLDKLTLDDGLLSWDGVRLGMTIPQIERRVGATVAIQKSKEAGCPVWIAEAEHHGILLTIGFPSPKPSGKVESIRVRFDSALTMASGRDLATALRAKFPDLQWLPPKEPAGIKEEDDLEPDYSVSGKEPQIVRLYPRESLVLGKASCIG